VGRFGCSSRLAHRFPPRPAPILEGKYLPLGTLSSLLAVLGRTCVLSQTPRSFCGMTSLTPTSQTDRHADPSDLLYLALRFASSAYLASEHFLLPFGALDPDPEPPTALRALPTPTRTPRLIVGQALDRMAA
jgi:hypothetical protein